MRAGLFAIFVAAPALACPRIEYVEARDWSAAQVERAYCDASKEATFRSGEARRLAVVEHEPYKAEAMLRESNSCGQQRDMLGRLLENVHKRPLPACK